MITIERSTEIDAPVDIVWSTLADFGGISTWAGNVDHSCLMTEACHGDGAVRRIQSGRTTVVETVVAWEPNAVLSYSITGLPPVIRAVVNTWRLSALGNGTRVSLTTTIDAGPRPPQQLIAKIVGRKLAQASDDMLAGLTDHLEPAGVA